MRLLLKREQRKKERELNKEYLRMLEKLIIIQKKVDSGKEKKRGLTGNEINVS